jgi:beta-xylosidase
MAAQEVLDMWQKDVGFLGFFRLQYNLWEIQQLNKDKVLQDKLISNYEGIIKRISDAGGVVILSIFGTPAGLGRTLDVRSPPRDPNLFKTLIKSMIRQLSCTKRYNIWYEVWSAPDLEEFFLGRRQEYFNLYKVVAESINELEAESKIHIPLGAPSSSWWFQNFNGNTIITPERSLIYELIKFCYRNHLPLDFITWHGYSTDPGVEKEITTYKKTPVELIRDWLSYFNFDRNTPLIVDEWNYDSGENVISERAEDSFVCASYLPSRISNMYEAGIDYQIYFSLEDFQNRTDGMGRNVGIFWFNPENHNYQGGPKLTYNVFKMLASLGNNMFISPKPNDEFVGVIAAKKEDEIGILIYNYIDPQIARNYVSKNIASLKESGRRALINLAKSGTLEKIMLRELDVSSLRLSNKVKLILKKAQELNDLAAKYKTTPRNMKIGIKNLKENYLCQRYILDSSCSGNAEYVSVEEKDIRAPAYQEILSIKPYSVNMIVLKKKSKEQGIVTSESLQQKMHSTPAEGNETDKTTESVNLSAATVENQTVVNPGQTNNTQ